MDQHPARRRLALATGATILGISTSLATGCGDEPVTQPEAPALQSVERVDYSYDDVTSHLPGWNAPDDLPSTRPFPLGGGASIPRVQQSELPALSELAIAATVLHIHRPVANTVSGELPVIQAGGGHGQLRGLVPVTHVDVLVDEVLGQRPDLASPVSSGEQITLNVGGGWLDFVLDAVAIEALGIVDTPPSAEEGLDHAHGTLESKRPKAPHPFRYTVSPSIILDKGEQVVLFLKHVELPRFADGDFSQPSTEVDAIQVVFGESGIVRLDDEPSVPDDVRQLAARLDQLSGPANRWPGE